MRKHILLVILIFLLSSCQVGPAIRPTAIKTTPALTYIPQPEITNSTGPMITPTQKVASNCSADDLVEELKKVVPYDIFTLSYQTFQGVRYLFFWIVDPSLDPTAMETELEVNIELAMKHSIELAYKFEQADTCTVELFDAINPVVVDINYNGWFSGIIEIKDLTANSEITENNIKTIEDTIKAKGAWQRQTVTDIQKRSSNSCTWNEVLEYVSRHFSQKPLNSYMLVADNNGITFTVQYQGEGQGDEAVVFLNTGREVACLQPPVDIITVILVDETGNVTSVNKFPMDR